LPLTSRAVADPPSLSLAEITHDKCGGRSTSDCAEPWYNARTAAKYFKSELDNSGGQFLKALGAYNGVRPSSSSSCSSSSPSSSSSSSFPSSSSSSLALLRPSPY